MVNSLLRGLLLLVAASRVLGAETDSGNILGLPTPNDPKKPGAVMLHGGGLITEDAFARFVELAGGKKARIVLVPSAGYRRADYDNLGQFQDALKHRFNGWVRLASTGRIAHFEFLATDDPSDADRATFVRPLVSATGVWFCGGMQERLNYRYVGDYPRKSRFQQALLDVVKRGGVVGGMSAGMAAMPEIMTLDEDRDRSGGPAVLRAAHGFGLLTGAVVETHFDSRAGRQERFTGLLRDSARIDRLAGRQGVGARMLGLAAEDSSALVLRPDGLEVLGGGNAHVYIKSTDDRSLTWHTLKPGEKAVLRRDERGRTGLKSGSAVAGLQEVP